jgi:hypothetical protein
MKLRKARPGGNKKPRMVTRPIRDNLLRHLVVAKEELETFENLDKCGYGCGYALMRAREEVQKLIQLTGLKS